MKDLFFVFLGGGFGSVARFGLGRVINTFFLSAFPVATLVINVLASLILGFFLGYLDYRHISVNSLKLLVAVGFCGGFSTFSTFSNETLSLLRTGHLTLAISNIFLSVLLCLGSTFVGLLLARNI